MPADVQLAYAFHPPTNRMISIREAANGAACACVCPNEDCNKPLIAHQGRKRAWHFHHAAAPGTYSCLHAPESMLHRIAKQFIADRKFIHYPELIAIHPAKGPIRVAPRDQLWAVTVQTEPTHIEGLRPDALLITKSGRQLAVEVNVTNPKDAETAAKYAAAGLDCIEIDAIGYRDSLDAEELPRIIIEIATRRWIYSARIATAEAEFAEEHRRQQAQKLAIERAEQLARDEAERQRQAAARAHAEQQRRLAEAAREQAKRRAHAEAADLNAKLQAAKDADARQRVHAFKLDLAAYAYDRLGNQRGYDWLRQPTLTLPGYSVLDWPEWDTPTEADFQSIRMEIDALACHCLAL